MTTLAESEKALAARKANPIYAQRRRDRRAAKIVAQRIRAEADARAKADAKRSEVANETIQKEVSSIAASDTSNLARQAPQKMKPMQTMTLSDRVKAIQLSDPSLDFDSAFTKALANANVRDDAKANEILMSDPQANATNAQPTAVKLELLRQYQALDRVLRDADVQNAQETARERVRPTAPTAPVNQYRAALALIANSPDMSREEADKLAAAAQEADRAALQARMNFAINPPRSPYQQPLVRG